MAQIENGSSEEEALEIVEELAILMKKLAPEIPFNQAMSRLEKASQKYDQYTLYVLAYHIVVGQVEP